MADRDGGSRAMREAMSTPARGGFPRIAEYAFLSDCHTSALVAPDGSVEWLCLPRFDSESFCAAILDRDAGRFRFGPAGSSVPVARRYEPGTNVLETTWATDGGGWLVVRDALAVGPWRARGDDPHQLPPAAYDAEHALVRVAECIQGEVDLELVCALAPGYATRNLSWERHGRAGLRAHETPELRLEGDLPLELGGDAVVGRRTLNAGERCFCALGWGREPGVPEALGDALEKLDVTREYWRRWLAAGSFPEHPWRDRLQRSALVLKGLIYAPTGATVAAATTSLPETPGGERNWDYRFTWIRDATFTLWGLHVLGFTREADGFAAFISALARRWGPRLQIMYGIGGERDLDERTLTHLSGYEGARPVRVGNAAHDQRQNDVYGALVDSLYLHCKAHEEVDPGLWEVAAHQVEEAARVWHEPDQGIWESRGAPKHYVSSKVMCWVALERGARLAALVGDSREARWRGVAAEIKADVLTRGVSDRGVFRQHYETDALDASTLLVPLVRFLPPDDERVRNTVLAIADELTVRGLVLRYRVEETDDGLEGIEGTFTICSFWLATALSEIGEATRARELCERLLHLAGGLGLYAEEIEPRSGAQLGNFPQAFTHLSLINAVSHVIADELRPPAATGAAGVFTEMLAGVSSRSDPTSSTDA